MVETRITCSFVLKRTADGVKQNGCVFQLKDSFVCCAFGFNVK